jgi:transposase
MPLPAAPSLLVSDAERRQLIATGEHRGTPRGAALRINIILDAAAGLANRVIARKHSTSVPTVLLWRKRWESGGMAGILEDRPRSGRPKDISPTKEEAIVKATVQTTPKGATHWSVRSMSPRACSKINARLDINQLQMSMQRIGSQLGITPDGVPPVAASYSPAGRRDGMGMPPTLARVSPVPHQRSGN